MVIIVLIVGIAISGVILGVGNDILKALKNICEQLERITDKMDPE